MKPYTCIILLIALTACEGNYPDVVINGQVKDSLTGEVISGAEITITCWVYDTDIRETRKVIKGTASNIKGDFSIHFQEGEALDIEVKHPNYHSVTHSKTLNKSLNDVEFQLNKIQ